MTTPEGPAATRLPVAGQCICGYDRTRHEAGTQDCRFSSCHCPFFRQEDEISIALQDGSLRVAPDPADEVATLRARLVEVELEMALAADRADAAVRMRDEMEAQMLYQLGKRDAAESRAFAAEARLSEVEGALRAVEAYAAELAQDAKERQPEIAKMHRRGEEVDAAFHGGGADAQRGIAGHLRKLVRAALSGSPPISGAGEATVRKVDHGLGYPAVAARCVEHGATLANTSFFRCGCRYIHPAPPAPISDPDSSQKGSGR